MVVLRVAGRNVLEMCDFIVFGFYVRPIGQAFFLDRVRWIREDCTA